MGSSGLGGGEVKRKICGVSIAFLFFFNAMCSTISFKIKLIHVLNSACCFNLFNPMSTGQRLTLFFHHLKQDNVFNLTALLFSD